MSAKCLSPNPPNWIVGESRTKHFLLTLESFFHKPQRQQHMLENLGKIVQGLIKMFLKIINLCPCFYFPD